MSGDVAGMLLFGLAPVAGWQIGRIAPWYFLKHGRRRGAALAVTGLAALVIGAVAAATVRVTLIQAVIDDEMARQQRTMAAGIAELITLITALGIVPALSLVSAWWRTREMAVSWDDT